MSADTGSATRTPLRRPTWSQWIEPLDDADDWPHRELRLGFDTRGRLLETVVLVFESGHELIIHAMPARKQFWSLLP